MHTRMDWINGIMILLSLMASAAAFLVSRKGRQSTIVSIADNFYGMMKKRRENTDWYRKKKEYLAKKGAKFHYGKNIDPVKYFIFRCLAGLAGFYCAGVINIGIGFIVFGVLFFLPELLLEYLNRKDNEKMLPDIKMIYNSLAVQIRAGIYVTDALCECHRNIREKRLRSAFLDLAGDILMKADIFSSLEKLQAGFSNRYIDSLCITILQALESGQAVEALNDIGEQIRDMEGVLLEKKKGALDRSITFYQLGILLAELVVVLYACVRYMFRMAGNF